MPIRKYNGLEPVYPSVSMLMTQVDSLQPEFRWQAAQEEGTTYDFAIWEMEGAYSTGWGSAKQSWGKLCYFVENLKENYHRITKPLEPGKKYNWSVRVRRGTYVSDWSAYNQTIVSSFGTDYRTNAPFSFKTPKE